MQPQYQLSAQATSLSLAQHKVLRNTYLLLALSMIPTTLGALVGIQLNFSFFAGRPMVGLLVFLAIAWGLMFGIEKTKHSSMGVLLMLAFTFFMGLMLSQILQVALHFRNGAELISIAAGGTAAIFFSLAGLATVTKKDFSFMGKFLFIGLVIVFIAVFANAFFAIPALSLTISGVAILLFSGYILFDISRIIHGGETNYITATLSLYLDIYNIFTSLLHILLSLMGERD